MMYAIQYKMGIGDWGLGIGDWGLGIGPNPQSPNLICFYTDYYNYIILLNINGIN